MPSIPPPLKLPAAVVAVLADVPVKMRYRLEEVCEVLKVTPPTITRWEKALGIMPLVLPRRGRTKDLHDIHRTRYYRRSQVERFAYAQHLAEKLRLPFEFVKSIINTPVPDGK